MQLSLLPLLPALVLSAPLFGQSLPAPAGTLAVRGGEEASTLLEVAEAYAERLGLPLAVSGDAKAVLGRARVGLVADALVPAESVHAFAQSLLVLGGFVITGVGGELRLDAYSDGERQAIEVEETALAALAGYEALLVRVPAEIEGVDARQLAASLRALAQPGLPGPVLTARDNRVLEVEGPAESVRRLIDVLRRCSSEVEAPAPDADWAALFPAPQKPDARFEVRPEDKLLAVIERYVAATGRELWLEEHLRAQLLFEDCGLLTPVACDVSRAHALVEAILFQHEISITVRGSGAHAIHAVQRGYRSTAARPILVDLERADLALLRDHPATVFGGVLRIGGIDARIMSTSLRVLMTDTNTQAALALDGSSFYMHGGGARTAQLAAVILEVEGRLPNDTGSAAELAESVSDETLALTRPAPNMLDLMSLWASAGGRAAILSDADARFLGNQRLEGLPAEISAKELHALLERELADRGLGLAVVASDPALVTVTGPTARRAGAHRFVAAGSLDSLASEGSLLITTLLPLEKIDARKTAMVVRAWLTDTVQQHVLAFGSSLVLGGTVGEVRANVARIRECDALGELPELERGR